MEVQKSLLAEASRLNTLVAGEGFEPPTFGL
jgi:hypothetical protein